MGAFAGTANNAIKSKKQLINKALKYEKAITIFIANNFNILCYK